MNDSSEQPRIVGIGASAGGIEACKALFEAAPADGGAAFIVVLHLDPGRTSHIAEILQHQTRLTVRQAAGSARLQPDHVYVIAPNSELQLREGTLHVEPLDQQRPRSELVDLLFESLAEADGERAIGVVLSGAGRDGCKGLGKIKAVGGLCLAQAAASALAASMPQAAIDAGVVDAALPPEAIPAALLHYIRTGERPQNIPAEGSIEAQQEVPAQGFSRIIEVLGTAVNVNFDDYKLGTLQRRTLRRMSLKSIESWDEYADWLAKDADEVQALYHDVLIGVTEFFRDPPVWEKLAAELPALLERRAEPGLRIWVPACGTGEEAYTLAMVAFEALPPKGRNRIQVYASDLNLSALRYARRGAYSLEHMANVSTERREHYFRQSGDNLQVDPRIRDCVTFAPHNALENPPFSRMDIVSCRNLLIYLKPPAHDRLLKRFHFSLRTGGLLLLGRSETPGRLTALFEDLSRSEGLYRAREARTTYSQPMNAPPLDRFQRAEKAVPQPPPADVRPDRRIEQFVLNHRTPACVAVDSDLQIVHFYGETHHYLVPPAGEVRHDLLAWIRPGFYIRLRSASKRAIDSQESVTVEGQIERDGAVQSVQCTIEPIARAIATENVFLVTFRDIGGPQDLHVENADSGEPLARELEQELVDTRRELMNAVEQLEAAGEEHRASHEELLSLNEELQSSNEELEASKEELEALNEEMNTINRELEDKNADLRAANADLNNLFLSTGIPTIFLDGDLNIRRFTPAAADVMRLVPSDVGRSIAHVKERFEDGQTLHELRDVLKTLVPRSREIWTEDDRCYLRNVQPYRNDDHAVDGICMTFTDVTEQRQAAMVSEAARRYAESIIHHVRTPLLVVDERLRIVACNTAFVSAFGIESDIGNRPLADCEGSAWYVDELARSLRQVVETREGITDREVRIAERIFLVNLSAISRDEDDDLVLVSFEDVTRERRERDAAAERQREMARDASRKDQWIAMLGHELRNPIGAIANGIELSRQEGLDAERRANVNRMLQRQVRQMNRLLDDLLDAGRVIAGKLHIDREPVDVAQVVAWSLETIGSAIEKRRHELSVSVPEAGTVWVEGDGNRLTEVLSNLLSNAVKYTDPGGRLRLSVEADDDAVSIAVEDNGTGIAADFMPHIFDVFSQGPRGLDRAAKGLGLGLPLVKNLVEMHGGSVRAASEGESKGSRFEVSLPRLSYASGTVKAVGPAAAPRPRRILVVDDERDSVESLALLLEAAGHDTRSARSGTKALRIAAAFAPEVVLLDLGMPRMDGYETARRLRDNGCTAAIIAMTGYQQDPSREREAGIDRHLIKPINHAQLAQILATIV